MAEALSTETLPESTLSRANPFPGLRPYGEEDASWFYGRSGETNDLLKRLRRLHFVAVVGASGSGKSSLVRAGVLPQIRDGYLDAEWSIATLRPGERPIANLGEAIGVAIGGDAHDLASVLHSGPAGLVRAVEAVRLPAEGRLLILVDQFEELFQFAQRTGDAAQEEIKEFLKLLLTAASSDTVNVYVMITMRLEWLSECASYPGLAEAINEGIYLVPQMSRRQFQRAILGPLEAADGSISSALLDRMLNDLDNKSDQLPVLQHALMRLWQREAVPSGKNTREPLNVAGYESVGTFTNCLSAHAEEVFAEFTPEQQRIAEVLFRNITQVNRNRKMRRPRAVSDMMQATGVPFAQLTAVIQAFSRPGRSFLVTTQGEITPASIVDISHEALIRQWARLSAWVDNEAEIKTRLRRMEEDAAEWDRDRVNLRSCLYSGGRLVRAEELRAFLDPGSTSAEFLRESVRARFWMLARRRGWISLAAVLVIAVAVGIAFVNSERAKASAALASLAEAQRQQAVEAATLASTQAKKAQDWQANVARKIDEAKGNASALAAIAQSIQAQRVYLQYVPGKAQLARTVTGQLQSNGFAVPGAEQVSPSRAPSGMQVRFFHPEDRGEANRLAALLRPIVDSDVSIRSVSNPNDVVPQGQFEVWLVQPPAPETNPLAKPANTPTTAAGAQPAPLPAPAPAAPAPPPPAPTLTASISQERIQEGRGVTLMWHTENASNVEIEGVGTVQPSGQMLMTPAQSTTYRLIAKGGGGTATKVLNVEVAAAPAPAVANVPAAAAVITPSEPAAVKAALTRYKDAYESESLDEVRRAWPSIDKAQQKNMSYVFNQFNAIHLDLSCPEQSIHVDGDSATAICHQTAVYTQKGKRQPEQATSTSFKLRKQGDAWVVDSIR